MRLPMNTNRTVRLTESWKGGNRGRAVTGGCGGGVTGGSTIDRSVFGFIIFIS